MNVTSTCDGLFMDMNNSIYCSQSSENRVVKGALDDITNMPLTVAGIGSSGAASNELDTPYGIFVTLNFSLYVADTWNSRIQRFDPGQTNGITVASNGLSYPTGITVDADDNLFIADQSNMRIVEQGPNGLQCLVGCMAIQGSASNQLAWPWTVSFDSYGNMIVSDQYNNRIQKFILYTDPCCKFQSYLIRE
jgi:streptogramin lyase